MKKACVIMAVAALATSGIARADDESDRAAAERLAAIVHDQAEIDQGTRTAVIAGFIAAGVASIAIGVPLVVDGASHPTPRTTNEQIELWGGATFIGLGGLLLVTWPLAFIRTPAERLDTRVATLATLPPAVRLARAEAALSAAADTERGNRRLSGGLLFTVAALEGVLVGLNVALTDAPVGLLAGAVSVIAIIAGAVVLATPGPMERTWRTWRVGTGRPAARFTPIIRPTGSGVAVVF